MRPSVSGHAFFFALLTIILIAPNCLAANGKVTEETVTTYKTPRKAYIVSGWENDLVKGSPNLGNYYWNPTTRYFQKTGSKRTGRQANFAHAPQKQSHYVKPIHAPLPQVDRQLTTQADVSGRLSSQDVSAALKRRQVNPERGVYGTGSSEEVNGVLTYSNTYQSGSAAAGAGYNQKLTVKGELYRTR